MAGFRSGAKNGAYALHEMLCLMPEIASTLLKHRGDAQVRADEAADEGFRRPLTIVTAIGLTVQAQATLVGGGVGEIVKRCRLVGLLTLYDSWHGQHDDVPCGVLGRCVDPVDFRSLWQLLKASEGVRGYEA